MSAVGVVHCVPMYLLVVVSQLGEHFVVRCYDFSSGETKEAARPDPEGDAALIKEFKVCAVAFPVVSKFLKSYLFLNPPTVAEEKAQVYSWRLEGAVSFLSVTSVTKRGSFPYGACTS